jgi:dihydrofolate reductase
MKLSIIVATSLNHAIGKDNKLLWHLPADLNFFKNATMGCPVVMGRKTFQSIGRVLPGRKNVVITNNKEFNNGIFDIEVVSSLDSAIENLKNENEVFIIGGGEIYRQSIDRVDNIYITTVNTVIDGDVYFPEIDLDKFKLVWESEHKSDQMNKFDCLFRKYVRI